MKKFFLKTLLLSSITFTNPLFSIEPALAECTEALGAFATSVGSVNGVPARVKFAGWAHGSCANFDTGNQVYEVYHILSYRDNCTGSYADCGYMSVMLDGEDATELASYEGSILGWKLKTQNGKIFKLLFNNPD